MDPQWFYEKVVKACDSFVVSAGHWVFWSRNVTDEPIEKGDSF